MKVTIDPHSGFCFGVVFAINAAEEELERPGDLYCLGDIVHNNHEVERLSKKGLIIIDHNKLKELKDCRVLIRAHGEPPDTYRVALENNIELIDASCPVVLKLQNSIRCGYETAKNDNGQIVIFGKERHAEVNGLVGQTGSNAVIINGVEDIDRIDFSKSIYLYSQTTKSTEEFRSIVNEINKRVDKDKITFIPRDTICRQVSNRIPQIKKFASEYDVIVFVSDKKSSNGTFLFNVCMSVNKNSYFISSVDEIRKEWFINAETIGVSGATSTPRRIMEEVQIAIMSFCS